MMAREAAQRDTVRAYETSLLRQRPFEARFRSTDIAEAVRFSEAERIANERDHLLRPLPRGAGSLDGRPGNDAKAEVAAHSAAPRKPLPTTA